MADIPGVLIGCGKDPVLGGLEPLAGLDIHRFPEPDGVIDNWLFRGRDGIEIERELPTLFTFRDGLIVRVDGFTDRAEALKAAGLSE